MCPRSFPEGTSIRNHERWHNQKFRNRVSRNISDATKGRVPWNKGLTKADNLKIREASKRLSSQRRGEGNPNWGKGKRPFKKVLEELYILDELSRQQIADRFNVSKSTVDKWLEFYKIKLSDKERLKRIGPKWSPERKTKFSNIMKTIVMKKREVYLNNLRAVQKRRPTSIEIKFMQICQEHDLPFKYVGDGAFWIKDLNPDFVNVENKMVVEILGEYWHTEEETENRVNKLASYGYKALMIWGKELDDEAAVVEKVGRWTSANSIVF